MSHAFVRLVMRTDVKAAAEAATSGLDASRTDAQAGAEALVEGVAGHRALATRSHAAECFSRA